MPKYTVRVTCSYPVGAVSPEDALATVPIIVRIKHIGTEEAFTEIVDASTNQVVLKAKLNQIGGNHGL